MADKLPPNLQQLWIDTHNRARFVAWGCAIGSLSLIYIGAVTPNNAISRLSLFGGVSLAFVGRGALKISEDFQKLTDDARQISYENTQQWLDKATSPSAEALVSFEPPSTPELVNPIEIIQRRGVSVLIFGNSGSGKSSVANLLIGEITAHRPAMVIVADHHLNDWGKLPVIGSLPNVLRTVDAVVKELVRRQEDWQQQCRELPKNQRQKNYPYLIFLWDEIGACLSYAKSKEGKQLIKDEGLVNPSDALLRLGSELRKFNGMFIGLNQSGTTDALGIDSSYRSNFVDIHLGESALKQIQVNQWKKEDPRAILIQSQKQGYPCVVKGECALHPTHSHHSEFREGNTPKAIQPPRLLPITLQLPTEPIIYDADIIPTDIVHQTEEILEEEIKPLSNNPLEPIKDESEVTVPVPEVTELPDDAQNNAETFLELRNLREQGTPKSTIIKEHWGYTGRNFETGLELYERLVCNFAYSWVAELLNESELTQKAIFNLVYAPNKRNKNKLKDFEVHYTEILNRLGHASDDSYRQ